MNYKKMLKEIISKIDNYYDFLTNSQKYLLLFLAVNTDDKGFVCKLNIDECNSKDLDALVKNDIVKVYGGEDHYFVKVDGMENNDCIFK